MTSTAGRGRASLPGTVHPTKGRRKNSYIEISEKVFRCTFSYRSGDLAGWCKFRWNIKNGEVSLSYPQSELYFIASVYNGWFDWLLRQSILFVGGGGREKMSLKNSSELIARLWGLCEVAEHTNCGSVVGNFVQASKG